MASTSPIMPRARALLVSIPAYSEVNAFRNASTASLAFSLPSAHAAAALRSGSFCFRTSTRAPTKLGCGLDRLMDTIASKRTLKLGSSSEATNSWMYDAPGLRLLMEAFGPGYSYTVNSLQSPAGLFISDAAATAVADSELALEKAQATRGALVLEPNEPDLYGYIAEWRDAISAFEQGKNALLDFEYGRLIAMLVMAAYMAHEKKQVIDLTDPTVLKELESYVPLIQQGKGTKVLADG